MREFINSIWCLGVKDENTQKAADFIKEDFYVDDGIKSVATVDEAVKILKNSHNLCKMGGFHLHRFVANNTKC